MPSYSCKKCGGDMNPSTANSKTHVGGPGKVIECLKCEKCGWSTKSAASKLMEQG